MNPQLANLIDLALTLVTANVLNRDQVVQAVAEQEAAGATPREIADWLGQQADAMIERNSPGTGQPMSGIEAKPDGTAATLHADGEPPAN